MEQRQITDELREKRERVYLMLAGFFLCSMTMLNIIGLTRFIQIGPMALAVGVLPYPLTFLCTDFVSELYGRKRANFLVTVGLALNFFIIGTMWLGHIIPDASAQPPWQVLHLSQGVDLPNGSTVHGAVELYTLLYATTSGAIFASMMAYILAQYVDVVLFHFWRDLTKGKHLWLRNNGSTMISQLVDSVTVITVTFGAQLLLGKVAFATFLILMGSNYLFKFVVALCDTLPFYVGVHYLSRYLELTDEELRAHAH
ncbi:MAG TPA: queuosine precursor transporter [Pseudomonadales bacterium]|nr:queuosine precursor transporter [Pseudomonadales bacterium]